MAETSSHSMKGRACAQACCHSCDTHAGDLRTLTREQVREFLASRGWLTVPEAGAILAGVGRGASYRAAASGSLGVPVFRCGHEKRCSAAAVEAVLFPEPLTGGDDGD